MYEGTMNEAPVCLYLENFDSRLKGAMWTKEKECLRKSYRRNEILLSGRVNKRICISA